MNIFDKCHDYIYADQLKEQGIYPYFKTIEDSEGPEVTIENRKIIMAGSNNYLGLTTHPRVIEAVVKATEQYGSSCSGSRFLTGTTALHVEMEEKVARFMGKESALLFTTGYLTAQGVIAPLVGRGEYLFSDKDNHASIVVGNTMSSALNGKVIRYQHNNMADLENRLSRVEYDQPKLIVTDGVFSTFGTMANMGEITRLAREYNANVVMDDAHGFGLIGPGGKGTAHYFGVENEVDMTICTFSKSLASTGGFVVGDERVINYLKHNSPALMFSASPTPAAVASALTALEIIEESPDLPLRVLRNTKKVRIGLEQMGFNLVDAEAAIIAVMIGDNEKTFRFWQALYEEGLFVNAFISPAVRDGEQMLRLSFMASHQDAHLDFILHAFKKIGTKLGIITEDPIHLPVTSRINRELVA
jgi:8-amino-7-oxononanoate synthase